MNDSHDIDMPYHPGCAHRYTEHLDHNALIARLNEIADTIYRLTQLCVGLEEQLVNHDSSSDAHRSIRESITAVGSRIANIKVAVDDTIAALDTKVNANYSTLNAADGQLTTRIDNIDTEIAGIHDDIANITLDLEDSITSGVSGTTPIIKSVADPGDIALSEIPSTHGAFRYKVENTRNIVTYTANNNSTGVPNYTAVLLDESGNATFPKTVTAVTFDGKATTAGLADTVKKLNTSIDITIKDNSGENTGPTTTTDLSSNVVLKLPSTLKGTDITGVASKASADATGANIVDTYVHKTNVAEEINGVKTFNDTVKGSIILPKAHADSTLGNSATPYEYVYATNITGTTATIPSITGNLTGNATTATKLATARKINGTDFDGSSAITTANWGTARNISITDASATNTGAATSVNGSGNVTLKLPSTIKAALTGNASTATKLATARKINNTAFDGSADITTANWGTARNISITDASATNTGAATSVNGSGNVTLKLPSTISADKFNGVASSAAKLDTTVYINGTAFNGSANITTGVWGYARNVNIASSDDTGASASVAIDGSSNVTLKLPATIKATLNGNADTATKLKTARAINGTNFDGSAAITTANWGAARNINITDATASNNGTATSVNGSSNVTLKLPATIKATLTGNADTATKLATARKINGTDFDGSSAITTANWGTARNISIADSSSTNTGTATSVNGSGNATLKLPATIKASLTGNASTATKLATARTINGTNFDGSAAITTANWGTARNISIADDSGTNTGTAVSVNGAANATLKLPSTIKATLTGNADTATEFKAKQTVALTGDVTGTASSKGGWSIATTLTNSGVTAGTYGAAEGINIGAVTVPRITVDAKGRITNITNQTARETAIVQVKQANPIYVHQATKVSGDSVINTYTVGLDKVADSSYIYDCIDNLWTPGGNSGLLVIYGRAIKFDKYGRAVGTQQVTNKIDLKQFAIKSDSSSSTPSGTKYYYYKTEKNKEISISVSIGSSSLYTSPDANSSHPASGSYRATSDAIYYKSEDIGADGGSASTGTRYWYSQYFKKI